MVIVCWVATTKSENLFLFTKSVRFGRAKLFFYPNPLRETYRSGMVSRPVLSIIKGKLDFDTCRGPKLNKQKPNMFNEFGSFVVPRSPNENKTVRKPGADIFVNVGG